MCDNSKCEGHVVKCALCEGSGKKYGPGSFVKCDSCGGVGSVLLPHGKR